MKVVETGQSRRRSRRKPVQGDLFADRGRGGKRTGAGRPRGPGRHRNWVRVRSALAKSTPVHVTLRVVKSVGGLRRRRAYHAIRKAIQTTWARPDFRIVHVSIQREHIHLICEADDKLALGRGMKGLQVSAARHLNAAVAVDRGETEPRRGTVFPERYHVEQLRSRQQVRNAITYVLNNWRHHREDLAFRGAQIDPYASGVLFDGWKRDYPFVPPESFVPLGTVRPQSWMLREGWRVHGAIDPREVPGERRDPNAVNA
jgi:REP element-mobilizing transposase RayT